MKIKYIFLLAAITFLAACAKDEPEVEINDTDFPYRLVIDEEGADLADAEDYKIEISFADYLDELPSSPITLTYTLSGEDDFVNVAIDEVLYIYEDEDCEFEREITFDDQSITIPVDANLGTVPEEFEIVVAFNLPGSEASDGSFKLAITSIDTQENVVVNDLSEFEYEILDNDLAGEWVLDLDETGFTDLKAVFGSISSDLNDLSFSEITGEVKFEFEFEEMKIEIELIEEENVTSCENGETETETENLIVEIEADYAAEEGELEMEGSFFNDEGEEIDFISEAAYEISGDNLTLTFVKVIDSDDHFQEGDELFDGSKVFNLTKD
ncbi:hypothetical protein N7E81_09870 [Reichenbachiella carrageenanivorans]|uniref:Calx-beta domain-containing protein n=1 Tax=Reichenbachiella carrageenanivorans TaxID=2979869 RepID=A0ABY6CWF6_9BACT|nr:hypothetical protein [Reichenbachiella carrageenanivorans]UXX77674.1 hypothetical protein N7E81_09870 [Reichenbachiella carrageenanivorans]